MAKNYNRCIHVGYISSDIEVKQTTTGRAVCNFSVGVRRSYRNSEGEYDSDFFSFVVWGSQADFVGKYMRKGSAVLIESSAQTRQYTDKAGASRHIVEFVVSHIQSVDDAVKTGNLTPPFVNNTPNFEDVKSDDDLPF